MAFHNANRLSVDLPSMTDPDHQNKDLSIADLVQDAVVADPDPKVVRVPGQFLAAGRPGICAQRPDRVGNPDPEPSGQLEQLAAS